MKRILLLVVGGVLLLAGTASAADRAKLQKAFVGIQTANAVVSSSAQVITGVSISSSGTAGVFSLYDASTLGTATNANGVWEGGSAANTSVYVSFDPPIRTTNGVTLVGSNINGVVVYTEQATP